MRFAIFGFFYELILNLKVTGPSHKTGKNLLALAPPKTFKTFTNRSLVPPGPDGDGELSGSAVGHGVANK
jgi:hypothetical protein